MMTPPPLNLFYFGDLLFVAKSLPGMDNEGQFAIVYNDEDHPEPGIKVVFQNGDVIVSPLSPEEQKQHFICFRRQVLNLPQNARAIFKKVPETILSENLSYLSDGFNFIANGPENPELFDITVKTTCIYSAKK